MWLRERDKGGAEAENEDTDDPEPKAVHEDSLSLEFCDYLLLYPWKNYESVRWSLQTG